MDGLLHTPQDTRGFFDSHSGDGVGAALGIGDGVNPQLVRVARWPHMGYLPIGEKDAYTVGVVHTRDAGEALCGSEELRQILSYRGLFSGRRKSLDDFQRRRAREMSQQRGAAETLRQPGEEI